MIVDRHRGDAMLNFLGCFVERPKTRVKSAHMLACPLALVLSLRNKVVSLRIIILMIAGSSNARATFFVRTCVFIT